MHTFDCNYCMNKDNAYHYDGSIRMYSSNINIKNKTYFLHVKVIIISAMVLTSRTSGSHEARRVLVGIE